jgi:hypothetical protein
VKLVRYTGSEAVLHPIVGRIEPGVNQIYDDAVAEGLLSAGRTSGEFLPTTGLTSGEAGTVDDPIAVAPTESEPEAVITAEADAPATPRRGRAKE